MLITFDANQGQIKKEDRLAKGRQLFKVQNEIEFVVRENRLNRIINLINRLSCGHKKKSSKSQRE